MREIDGEEDDGMATPGSLASYVPHQQEMRNNHLAGCSELGWLINKKAIGFGMGTGKNRTCIASTAVRGEVPRGEWLVGL